MKELSAGEQRKENGLKFKGREHGNETVIFVPATPGGELKRRYQEVIRAAKVKLGVSEVPGANLKKRLQKSDPFKERKCNDKMYGVW